MTTYVAPPKAVVDYQFSWNRNNGHMRFRRFEDDGTLFGEWDCEKFVGQWEFQRVDREGHMFVRCLMQMQGTTANCWVPDSQIAVPVSRNAISAPVHDHSQCQIATSAPFPNGRESHWRLCYSRDIATRTKDDACWRLRDERSGELWLVHDYEGVVNVNYLDRGSHIYVDGPVMVDDAGVAHFGGEE